MTYNVFLLQRRFIKTAILFVPLTKFLLLFRLGFLMFGSPSVRTAPDAFV